MKGDANLTEPEFSHYIGGTIVSSGILFILRERKW